MMKKLMAILMTAALLLTVLMTAACSLPDLGELESKLGELAGDETDENGAPVETPTEGGNGSSDSGSDLPYDRDSAQAKLDEFGKTTGYEITFTIIAADGNETVTITGRKGDVWWTCSSDRTSGKALVSNGDTSIAMYECSGGEWTMTSNLVGQDFATLIPMYAATSNVYLFMANTYESELKLVGSEKVAGRDCTKYSYSTGAMGWSMSWNCCVDKELGITLKWRIEANEGGDGGSQQMEVTEFKSGAAVTVPDLPAPGEDYTDYTGAMGWPSNSFTALIPQAPGTVSLSMIQGNQFAAVMKDVSESDFASYVDSLKAKGFSGETQDGIFEGTDANGNTVIVQYSEGQFAVSVEKAAE